MNKKDVIIVLLICVVCVLGGILIGRNSNDNKNKSDVTEKKSNTKKDTNSENKIKDKDKEIKKEGISVLDKAVGEWGQCDGEYDCYELIFNKKDNKYSYLMARMWSEPGGIGYVTGFSVVGTNKYKLTIHFDAEENAMVSTPEQTIEITFDLSKVESDIIKVNDTEFKKVVGDTEEFFKSLF